MINKKLDYEDFIVDVEAGCQAYVNELHAIFMNSNCQISVKEAKSGYMVAYLLDKKTMINYVFRKKGLIIRIYANQISRYMEFLDTLPMEMIQNMQEAPVCKRLINPDDCNPKCAMGYDYMLQGGHMQKCRNNAFMFLVCKENFPYIKAYIEKELMEHATCAA